MSKAKELANDLINQIHLYDRKYLDDDVLDNHTKELIELLVQAVLSEPESLKGWIEVDVLQSDDQHKTQCVNLAHITDFGTTPRGPAFINLIDSNTIIVKESYDSIKQKIKEAS